MPTLSYLFHCAFRDFSENPRGEKDIVLTIRIHKAKLSNVIITNKPQSMKTNHKIVAQMTKGCKVLRRQSSMI